MSLFWSLLFWLLACVSALSTVLSRSDMPDDNLSDGSTAIQQTRSDQNDALLHKTISLIQSNHGILSRMFRVLPPGIDITFPGDRNLLRLDGSLLSSSNWTGELNLLEFIPPFLTAMQIENLQLDQRTISYIYLILCKNSATLQSLSILNCTLANGCQLAWDFSQFASLLHFKLAGTVLSDQDVAFILVNLPSSLHTLDITLQAVLAHGLCSGLFNSLTNLHTLKLDQIAFERHSCISAILDLPKLKVLRFARTDFGVRVFEELDGYSPGWAEFSLNNCRFPNAMLCNLRELRQLEKLDLSYTSVSIRKLFQFLSNNPDSFPALKYVKMRGSECGETMKFPDFFARQGVTMEFDYELFLCTLFSDDLPIVTGIFTCFSDPAIRSFFSKPIALKHVTALTIRKFDPLSHVNLLERFLSYVPSLKKLTVSFVEPEKAPCIFCKQTNINLESLTLKFQSQTYASRSALSVLNAIASTKKLKIQCAGYFNFEELSQLALLHSVEELFLDTRISYAKFVLFFCWVSLLSKLTKLQVIFDAPKHDSDNTLATSSNHKSIHEQKNNIACLQQLAPLKLKSLDILCDNSSLDARELIILFSKLPYLIDLKLDFDSTRPVELSLVLWRLRKLESLRELKITTMLTKDKCNELLESVKHLKLLNRLSLGPNWMNEEQESQWRVELSNLPFFRELLLDDF